MAGAFNQVRYRARSRAPTLANWADATSFNELIRRERIGRVPPRNRRYHDICRWGIFEELERER